MFKKRGFSQVDWAISLAIFLMYLAWFFVIVKPQVIDQNILGPTYLNIKEEFLRQTSVEITKIPIFIKNNEIRNNQLVEFEVDFVNNFGIVTDKPYLREGGTVYLIDDFKNSTNIYQIVISNKSYPYNDYQNQAIMVYNGTINPNSDLLIRYDDEILGFGYLDNFKYYQDSSELTNENFTINDKHLFLEIEELFQPYEVRTSVVSGSNTIVTKIKKLDKHNDFNMTVAFDADYESYYINNDYMGSFEDINGTCVETTYNELSLNANENIYFSFNKDVIIKVCGNKKIIFTFDSNIKYSTSLDKVPEADYEVSFGIGDKSNYPLIDENLSVDMTGNFKINLYNTTSLESELKNSNNLYTAGSEPLTDGQIYSHEDLILTQDKYGAIERMRLNVVVW